MCNTDAHQHWTYEKEMTNMKHMVYLLKKILYLFFSNQCICLQHLTPIRCFQNGSCLLLAGLGQIRICICKYKYKYKYGVFVFVFVFDQISNHVFVFVFDPPYLVYLTNMFSNTLFSWAVFQTQVYGTQTYMNILYKHVKRVLFFFKINAEV